MAAVTGRMLMRAWGVTTSKSWMVIRSRITRSMREKPMRNWFCSSSPTRAQAAVAQVVDVVGGADARGTGSRGS